MNAWIIVAALYVIGGFGIYVQACDVNEGPIRTKWKRALFLIWPLVIIVQGAGDLWDKASGRPPYWLGGKRSDT